MYDIPALGPWVKRHSTVAGDNPSFLCQHPGGRMLYAVHGDGDTVSAFGIEVVDGRLTHRGTWPAHGRNPVHLAVSPDGRWLLVACYATGSVASLPVQADGGLGPVACNLILPGTPGPLYLHQKGSHPHQAVFNASGRWLLVPDKGLDRVFTLSLDSDSGLLSIASTTRFPAGSGPRHLVFHPSGARCYVACELGSQVSVCGFDLATGSLNILQSLPTIPAEAASGNTAAGIVLTGRGERLHVSNRGHNSIATFAIDSLTGLLSPAGWCGTGGRKPRFITTAPDGKIVVAANEDDDTIVAVPVTQLASAIGLMQPATLLAHTGSPVCIIFTKDTT